MDNGNEQLMTRILGDRWAAPTDSESMTSAVPIEDAEAVGEGGQE